MMRADESVKILFGMLYQGMSAADRKISAFTAEPAETGKKRPARPAAAPKERAEAFGGTETGSEPEEPSETDEASIPDSPAEEKEPAASGMTEEPERTDDDVADVDIDEAVREDVEGEPETAGGPAEEEGPAAVEEPTEQIRMPEDFEVLPQEEPETAEEPASGGETAAAAEPPRKNGPVTLEEFREIVSEEMDEIPEELFADLTGGVVISEDAPLHPKAKKDPSVGDLRIMGIYQINNLDRMIMLYYGTFRLVLANAPVSEWRSQVRAVLRHELRHHREAMAGDHGKDSLEREDEKNLQDMIDQNRGL